MTERAEAEVSLFILSLSLILVIASYGQSSQLQMLNETFIETLEMNSHLYFLKSMFPKYF